MNFLLVFVGAGLGGMLRHLVNLLTLRGFGPGFPVGTFAINITGSIVMGMVVGYLATRDMPSPELRLFVATGILGGYTTFSTFSLDTITLWQRGEIASAAAYVLGSLVLSFAGLWFGMAPFRRWI
jgi:CrcB protein